MGDHPCLGADVELLIVHGTRYIDEIVCQRVKDRG